MINFNSLVKKLFFLFLLNINCIFCANKIGGLKEFMDAIGRKDDSIDLFSSVDELDLKKLRHRKYLKKFGKSHAKAFVVRKDGDVLLEQANKEDNLGEKYYLVHNGRVLILYFVKDGDKTSLKYENYDENANIKMLVDDLEDLRIKPVQIPNIDNYIPQEGNFILYLLDGVRPQSKARYKNDQIYRLAFNLKHQIGLMVRYKGKIFLTQYDPITKRIKEFADWDLPIIFNPFKAWLKLEKLRWKSFCRRETCTKLFFANDLKGITQSTC
jgi:hypothetical protein